MRFLASVKQLRECAPSILLSRPSREELLQRAWGQVCPGKAPEVVLLSYKPTATLRELLMVERDVTWKKSGPKLSFILLDILKKNENKKKIYMH